MLSLLYKIVSECRSESMQEDGYEKIIRERFYLLTTNTESLRLAASFFVKIIFRKENVSLDTI